MGATKKKSRHNTFKSQLKYAPKTPTQIILSKGVTTYLITNSPNETPTGLIIILGTKVLAIFPFRHTFPLSC